MPPLVPIQSLANCFFIVLVTRSSSGQAIPPHLFRNLRQSVIDNYRKIRSYLKEKTGIDYEIHIISEAAANGSILSLESDMILHDRSDETNDLHLPMANAHTLKDLEISGIKPSEVIYTAYGIEIIAATP
ncbi:hypothetical protein DAPPUDRAFT_254885 [Daphnia pulex]|uniref:Uncharacterized protein n=1 Tax=Daphnia pulex TaxID=6669 RepID=E9H848_DAPPU|nr:hypothetical protein DAPPUDRAFT_254885 [Daphnia pulex]|eukprot:EFX72091.1 hypothetical protein DAPPUDRAFT_254885 [Daphnia pulex]